MNDSNVKPKKTKWFWKTILVLFVLFVLYLCLLIGIQIIFPVTFSIFNKPTPIELELIFYYDNDPEIAFSPFGALSDFNLTEASDIQELKTGIVSLEKAIIMTISQSQYSHELLVLDSLSVLSSYDLAENKRDNLIDFGHGSILNAAIDNSNKIVMMVYEEQGKGVLYKEIWELGSLRRIRYHYNLHVHWEEFYLLPTGDYSVAYNYDYPSTFFIDALKRNNLIQNDIYLAEDKDKLSPISSMAGDQYGDYLAVAFQNGKVIIGNIEEGDFLDDGLKMDDFFIENSVNVTQDFFFSYNNQYLVWLTENEVAVWLLEEQKANLILIEEVSGGNVAAVDRSGRWLVIGTENSLIFYDLEERYTRYKENGELPIVEPDRIIETSNSVRSIFFSLDNTMLIWGDDEGQVHVWGAIEE